MKMHNPFVFEGLERRQFLSASPTGLVPAQVRHAYGFDQVAFAHRHRMIPGDGRGQTIAIITAYDAPTIESDLNVFSNTFGLPTTDAYGEPTLTKVIHRSRPPADSGWALEASLGNGRKRSRPRRTSCWWRRRLRRLRIC
jgi:hypothetical protein